MSRSTSIEFHGVKVPDQNGAGIRAEQAVVSSFATAASSTTRTASSADSRAATITIERSEFARNGYGDGYSHNIYIGEVDRLTVVGSYFHEAKVGHNLKSRARETRIENSYFMDGPAGTSSYLADRRPT